MIILDEDIPKPEPKPEHKVPMKLKDQILGKLQYYYEEGRELDRTLFEHIANELNCSQRYVYVIHKDNKEMFAKTMQKTIQKVSDYSDIEKMLKNGIDDFGIDAAKIEEVTAILPLAKPDVEKKEEEPEVILLTESDVHGLVTASNIWIKRMLPPELEKDEINTLAKVWTPVLNKLMPQWGAEICAIITTGIIFAPRLYARAKKVKESKEEKEAEEGGADYSKFAG